MTSPSRWNHARCGALAQVLLATFALPALHLGLAACAGTSDAPRPATQSSAALRSGVEALSLDGRELFSPSYTPEQLAERLPRLEQALEKHLAAPEDVDALIWYGRRLGYLGRFRESIEVFSRATELAPEDPRPLRHRGHRWITVREFRPATEDLGRAAQLAAGRPDEVDPAGLPNARGVELDTLKQSIHYHQGLAHYLLGEFEPALSAWRACERHSNNADAWCSVSHWIYCALQSLGRPDEARKQIAAANPGQDIVENHGYHKLLLAYSGQLDAQALMAEVRAKGANSNDFASVGYGLAHHWIATGQRERGQALLREVAAAPNWPAFGVIAAEAQLARDKTR